jgi:hypothetical protein
MTAEQVAARAGGGSETYTERFGALTGSLDVWHTERVRWLVVFHGDKVGRRRAKDGRTGSEELRKTSIRCDKSVRTRIFTMVRVTKHPQPPPPRYIYNLLFPMYSRCRVCASSRSS